MVHNKTKAAAGREGCFLVAVQVKQCLVELLATDVFPQDNGLNADDVRCVNVPFLKLVAWPDIKHKHR
jgi:hypothetical protein